MCLCNPNVKTPFCGKPGCTWPHNTIQTPKDLSHEWHEKFVILSQRYRKTRLWADDREADEAAFRDTRTEYFRSQKPLLEPQPRPNNPESNDERNAAP